MKNINTKKKHKKLLSTNNHNTYKQFDKLNRRWIASLIANEYINGDSASCHENDANLKRLIYSSSAITAHPNRPHKSMSASALLSTSKQPQQRRPKQDTTTTNTLLITAASNSAGESCSIFERTREFDENGNMLEEELSAQQFSRGDITEVIQQFSLSSPQSLTNIFRSLFNFIFAYLYSNSLCCS